MKRPKVNVALRQWARGVSFTIAMGRRQVYTLVSLHLSAELIRGSTPLIGDRHRHMRSFVTTTECLVDRGLVIPHVWNDEKLVRANGKAVRELWQLSRAGELVVELLKEAGIYDEVKAELEAADRPRMRVA